MDSEKGSAPEKGDALGSLLLQVASGLLPSPAIVDGSHRTSYVALRELSIGFANVLLDLGVRPGDIVTSQLPNWWESNVVAFGCFLAGAIYNPVVSIYRERELEFILTQAKPKVVVVPEYYRGFAHLEVAKRLVSQIGLQSKVIGGRSSEDQEGIWLSSLVSYRRMSNQTLPLVDPSLPALLLYTSGTTATPKGVLHSHKGLVYEASSIAKVARLDSSDSIFMASPLTHITGVLYGTILPVMLGCKCVLMEKWNPDEAISLIEMEQCTFTVSATPFLSDITEAYWRSGHRSSLRVFVCGGADAPSSLIRQARRIMGTSVVRTYGSTEMPTATIGDPYGDVSIACDTDGLPIGPVEVKIDGNSPGSGELLVKGPELFIGYFDTSLNRTAFTPDGFFRTGDLANLDSRGAVSIVGRVKDIINRGGEKYSAREVEELLLEHPDIADVTVVAVPDKRLVEKACAVIVPRRDRIPTVEEIGTFLSRRGLALQKLPEYVVQVSSLARTPSGKIQKFLVREQAMNVLGDKLCQYGR